MCELQITSGLSSLYQWHKNANEENFHWDSRIEKIICHIICVRYFYVKYVCCKIAPLQHRNSITCVPNSPRGLTISWRRRNVRIWGRSECGEGENLGIPRDCDSNNNSLPPQRPLALFSWLRILHVSPPKPDHCKFRRNRDCESLESYDVMRYDLTASYIFAAFNLLPRALMAVIKDTLFSTLLLHIILLQQQ